MRKNIDLLDESIRPEKLIWFLAWPTILEQLLVTAVQYVDTAMVGSLGVDATAAVAVNSSTTWLINGLCAALGIGFSVLVGKNMGAKNYQRAKETVMQAILAMLMFGAVLVGVVQLIAPVLPGWMGTEPHIQPAASAYLSIIGMGYFFNVIINISANIIRCSGDTRTPMIANIFANVINVVLNFLFIFETRVIELAVKLPFSDKMLIDTSFEMWGAGLGVRGAAIATITSLGVSACILFLTLYNKDYPLKLSLRDKFRFKGGIWKEVLKVAYPVALERFTLSGGQILMTKIVTGLGTASLAAHSLAITAESITYMPVFGFSAAGTTLVSQSLGAEKKQHAVKLSRYCVIGGIIFMSLAGVILYVFSEALIGFFTADPEVIALGGKVLKIEAFAQPFFAMATVIGGVLRGAGDTKWPFYASLIGMWCIRLGLAFLLSTVFELGLTGAWIAMVTDLAIRGTISLLRYRSLKWLNIWDRQVKA